MADDENYYDILGVSKDASQDEIRHAYHKLALKHHPDKNGGDDTMFKKINTAHETLSDPDKRHEYDNPSQIPSFMNGFPNTDSLFQHLFENMSGFGGIHFNSAVRKGPVHRNNFIHNILITLQDVHFGTSKTLKIKLKKKCFGCRQKCSACDGNGMAYKVIRNGPFVQQTGNPCKTCNASGQVSKNNMACSICKGANNYTIDDTIKVDIPKGVESGHTIVFKGKGEQEQSANDIPGDFIVKIVIEEHPIFIRENDHLIYKTKLSLAESFIGKDIIIPHFDESINLNSSIFGIVNPNKRYFVKGKGLCNRGNLILQFEIVYPEKILDAENRSVLMDVFKKIGI